jgi:hypothetical protein
MEERFGGQEDLILNQMQGQHYINSMMQVTILKYGISPISNIA